ncbi:MAG: sugar phosphate isomerase/epimerase family protein [Christensenellales bacterium]|jgi:L-ribulose-5-phosphate 3-epimerase
MKLGVLVNLADNVASRIEKAAEMGFSSIQLCNWDISRFTQCHANTVKAALEKTGVSISSIWAGWSGMRIWNLYDGPLTLGLLPVEYRAQRVEDLKRGADFAEMLGVKQLITHAGFIPENPNEAEYRGMILALRDVASYCKQKGIYFLFETGQETPVTLIRAFEDIGLDNLGINLDPANLMMYGKANPVDALGLLGKYVMDVHAKDGGYPTCGKLLGDETALGKGSVDFPALIRGLKACGYDGALTIEREIEGDEQIRDILSAKAFLETLI